MFRSRRKYYVTIVWGREDMTHKDSYTLDSDKERQAFIQGLYEAKKHQGIDGLDFTVTREGYYDE